MNLPGIGVFSIDPSVTVPEPTDKNSHEFLQHIRFNQKSIAKPDEEFIDFIRTHTGKIRPLAESDLESFLSEGKILLNIGKPFHLEGIGTLQKSMAGTYEFHPGLPLLDRLENFFPEKDSKAANSKQSFEHDYSTQTKTNNGRVIWIVLAILVGLGAIIWGGYTLYNRNTDNQGTAANNSNSIEPVTAPEDTTQNNRTDSLNVAPDSSLTVNTAATPSIKTYKFIFRLGSKNYVINRFNELKPSNPNLYWDTKDSIKYRLYMALPAATGDTTHIRDSLQFYYGTKKVIIEQ